VAFARARRARGETRRGRDARRTLRPTRGAAPTKEEVPRTVAIFRAARRRVRGRLTTAPRPVVHRRFRSQTGLGATNERSGRESEGSLARGARRKAMRDPSCSRMARSRSRSPVALITSTRASHPCRRTRVPRDDGEGERARSGAGGGDRSRATRRGHETRADGHGPGGAVRVRARGVRETCVARVRPFSSPPARAVDPRADSSVP
jgi:hypothetical protein